MTTPNEAREAIYLRFTTDFTSIPNSRIVFENEDEPEDVGDSWVRLSMRGISRSQDTLGRVANRRFRSSASVFVQVYTDTNTGIQLSDTLAKEAADIFEGVSFSGLDFRAVTIQETGVDGKWNQMLVEAPFDYDEIK